MTIIHIKTLNLKLIDLKVMSIETNNKLLY